MYNFLTIKELSWDNAELTVANGIVVIEGKEEFGELPFAFGINDTNLGNEEQRKKLFDDFKAGKYGKVPAYKPYVPPSLPAEITPKSVRRVDIFMRATEAEAALLSQAINSAEARSAEIINATMRFTVGSEPYNLLHDIADDVISPERVAIIFAPSEL